MPQLLLELFSEEIPARMQSAAARDLERMAKEKLDAAGFTAVKLRAFAGPRRLTLVADDLPAAQADRDDELKGPKTSAPEQALEGFLRKTGLTKDQLTDRDGVWFAVVSAKGRPTAEIIAEMVDQIVRNFPWPKSMKWGTGTLRWVRPLQRILCLFDGAVVPIDIDGIKSGDVTEGHRFMGNERTPFAVKDFDDYRTGLAARYVVLEAPERKRRILDGAKAACAAKGVELVEDEGLLEEVAGLAEWPVPVLGDMDPSFLDLPPEVIRTSMRTHQKYFAVRRPGAEGLAPHFLVVANIEAHDGGKALAAGNARVLSARLNDARFFWDEDNKPGNFERWLEKLNGVTFHAKLGTMADRVDRVAALAYELAPLVGADHKAAGDAARYAKADLASGMVGEFPELQGVMGGYYADKAALPADIADAVRGHYKPQGPGDSVPTNPVAVAVALADKFDTLAGFFSIDERPTGSKDPYALRRAALGIVRIILENKVRLSLHQALRLPLVFVDAQQGKPDAVEIWKSAAETSNGVSILEWLAQTQEQEAKIVAGAEFILDRFVVTLRDLGKSIEVVKAGIHAQQYDLVLIAARVEALDAFLTTDDGQNLLAGFKRASNILRAEEKKGPLPDGPATTLASAPAEETSLLAALQTAEPKVAQALEAEDFAAAMTALAGLRKPVDAFFESVLVNSAVAEERDNRLRLLLQVRKLMERVADFSQISG